MRFVNFFIKTLLLGFFLLTASGLSAQDFTVVIDAGHGGHDPGAIGKISKEKDINLNVALRLGKLIEKNCRDTKVIYTRRKDVFVKLDRRAEIANNAKADLFISIHTNSLKNNRTVQGPSTWTLGLAKSDANLEVAKRENAVILYEDDYQTRYAGFNPNSAESYIIFEFMQDQYMEQSVQLASLVQKQFKNSCKRTDRGVHQAGFLVLKASAMPSILVELGFISTPEEERFLNSEKGVQTLAQGIYEAFCTYKNGQMKRKGKVPAGQPEQTSGTAAESNVETTEETTDTTTERTPSQIPDRPSQISDRPVFKIQFMASDQKLKSSDKRLKGLSPVEWYRENGLYKYTYGATEDYNEALRMKKKVAQKFKDAFIIAFRNGKKTNTQQAIRDFKNAKK